MVTIQIAYEGQLHCTAVHQPSSATLVTDAPVDNHGRGESFSPTDLLATALGTCMVTVMGIVSNRNGWNLDAVGLTVHKHMTSSPPRRVQRLEVEFEIPRSVSEALDDAARRALEQAAHTCPVRLSILEAIEVPVSFRW